MKLPPDLLDRLPDSDCELVSWDGERNELVLRITKDALLETGLVRFVDVQYVQLTSRMNTAGFTVVRADELVRHPLAAQFHYELDPDDIVVILWDSWDETQGFIVAASCSYEIIDNPL